MTVSLNFRNFKEKLCIDFDINCRTEKTNLNIFFNCALEANGCQQTQFAKTSKADSENEFTNTSSDKQEGECLCK
jgi:hypothetical protein